MITSERFTFYNITYYPVDTQFCKDETWKTNDVVNLATLQLESPYSLLFKHLLLSFPLFLPITS